MRAGLRDSAGPVGDAARPGKKAMIACIGAVRPPVGPDRGRLEAGAGHPPPCRACPLTRTYHEPICQPIQPGCRLMPEIVNNPLLVSCYHLFRPVPPGRNRGISTTWP